MARLYGTSTRFLNAPSCIAGMVSGHKTRCGKHDRLMCKGHANVDWPPRGLYALQHLEWSVHLLLKTGWLYPDCISRKLRASFEFRILNSLWEVVVFCSFKTLCCDYFLVQNRESSQNIDLFIVPCFRPGPKTYLKLNCSWVNCPEKRAQVHIILYELGHLGVPVGADASLFQFT